MRSILLLLLTASIAGAQPAPDAPDADALFKQGRELLAAGKFAEACDAFAKSDASDPEPATKLALGVCREKNHQLASAWRLYTEVVRELLSKTDPGSAQLARVAVTNANKIEPRLSKLTIEVSVEQRIPGLEIRRDGEAIDVAQWSQPVPIDGGTFTIEAGAAGRDPWSTHITVGRERDNQTVHVPSLVVHARREPTVPTPAARIGVVQPPREHAPRTLPIAFGVGAITLAGGAIVLELVGSRTYNKSQNEVDVDKQLSLWHTANGERYTAEAFGITAIACAGTAAWLYFRHHDEQRPRTAELVPTAAGFAIVGAF